MSTYNNQVFISPCFGGVGEDSSWRAAPKATRTELLLCVQLYAGASPFCVAVTWDGWLENNGPKNEGCTRANSQIPTPSPPQYCSSKYLQMVGLCASYLASRMAFARFAALPDCAGGTGDCLTFCGQTIVSGLTRSISQGGRPRLLSAHTFAQQLTPLQCTLR